MKEKRPEIGVIIGRFQIDELHDAHVALINHVINRHDKVIIFLGVKPIAPCFENALDFRMRQQMLLEKFGTNIIVLPLNDKKYDNDWSNQIDVKVREVYPSGDVLLYGGRDSFIPHYSGKFKTCELEPEIYVSATQKRQECLKTVSDPMYRRGFIAGASSGFPNPYPTVDVAIVKGDKVLLGRKPDDYLYRFVGGFVDVSDTCLEMAAKREVMEETGLEVSDLQYVCSLKVDDWRYRGIKSKGILTSFFKCDYIFGSPQPNDDICELKWFTLDELKETYKVIMVEGHHKLFTSLYLMIENETN